MIIYRMYKGKPIEIPLRPAEITKACEICRREDFALDFTNRCQERYSDEIGLCNLPADYLLEQPEILKKAYACYQKMQNCNVAFNDTLDAVIDELESQMQRGDLALMQPEVLGTTPIVRWEVTE